MDLLQILKDLQAQLANVEALVAVEKQASYDAGFAAGVASVTGNDKVYSQAEFDAKLAEAVSPLQAELAVVKAEVEGLKAEVLKASELVAKYAAFIDGEIADQAVDSQRIEAFKASLGV